MRPDDPRTDEQLVEAANAGDSGAFESLYERYIDWTLGLALRFTRDNDAARDVAHDAFLWLLKKFPGFELRAKMTTVLYPVVRHIALARRRGVHPAMLQFDDVDDDAVNALTQAGAECERDALAAAVDSLPIGQREAILLRFADDLPLAEIATALEIPLGTVKSRLHLAMESLRSDPTLKKYFEIE